MCEKLVVGTDGVFNGVFWAGKLLELEKLYETSRHALERRRLALEQCNEALTNSKKTPQDLATKFTTKT